MKGREGSPNFLPAWRVMEARDKKEKEELNRVFLSPKERWKQEMKVKKRIKLDKVETCDKKE
jgi:hypothetical protein